MTNAQEWLDSTYPLESRESVKAISASGKGLVGALKITGFPNLIDLHLNSNQLTKVDVWECSKLIYLTLYDNPLQEPPFTFLES